MAGSYREKFIPLFERATGLLKSGAIKPNNTPIWYNIYKAFPPEIVPDYNRPVPSQKVVNILYAEDVNRAFFHNSSLSKKATYNLFKMNHNSLGNKFLNEIDQLKKSGENLNENELQKAALSALENAKKTPVTREKSQDHEEITYEEQF